MLRDQYLAGRLGTNHHESQIHHFQKREPVASRRWRNTGLVADWSARLAPVFVLLALVNKLHFFKDCEGKVWHLDHHFGTWLLVGFLPIALPLLAGAASGLRHALDTGRRKDRYPQMAARLTEIRDALPGLQTESSIRSAVARSEELLLDELIEWQLAVKNTGAH